MITIFFLHLTACSKEDPVSPDTNTPAKTTYLADLADDAVYVDSSLAIASFLDIDSSGRILRFDADAGFGGAGTNAQEKEQAQTGALTAIGVSFGLGFSRLEFKILE